MRLDIYLNYFGNCEQAFRFYEQHLGGTITGIVRHREQPNPNVPADWGERDAHGEVVTVRDGKVTEMIVYPTVEDALSAARLAG